MLLPHHHWPVAWNPSAMMVHRGLDSLWLPDALEASIVASIMGQRQLTPARTRMRAMLGKRSHSAR